MTADSIAVRLAHAGLTAVFTRESVAVLRPDSPLSAVGFTDADMVCVADAIAIAAVDAGTECVLVDADFVDVTTVADLVRAVDNRLDDVTPVPA